MGGGEGGGQISVTSFLKLHCIYWSLFGFWLKSFKITCHQFLQYLHQVRYIHPNPCFSEVSGVGWGIFLCKDFAYYLR